uniref:BEN domain-containing protein n=1 Tax=Bactrocera latifrons TaxID=174628 RepID=A0A0K8UZN2_BACLA
MEKTTFNNEMREAFESVRMLKEAKNQEEFSKVMDAIYATTDGYLNAMISTVIEKKQTLLRNLEELTNEELEQMEISEPAPETNKRRAAPHDYSSFDGYCNLVLATLSDKPPIMHVPFLSHSFDDTDEDQLDDDDNDRLIIDESTLEEPLDNDDVIIIEELSEDEPHENDDMLIIDESSQEESHGDSEVNSDSQSVPRDSGVEIASSETESESVNGEIIETVRTPSLPESVAQLPEQNQSLSNEANDTVRTPSLPATLEELPDEDETSEFITIGPNGTRVLRTEFNNISWDSDSISTRNLLNIIFGEDMLATHTLSGKPSPAFKGRERPAKGQLDINKIDDLTHCVMQKTGCSERDVRTTITTKCADIAKKYRKRNINISYTDLN